MFRTCVILTALVLLTPVCSADVRDYTYFLDELVNLDGLSIIREGVQCAQAASCSREWKYNPGIDNYLSACLSVEADASKWIRIDWDEKRDAVLAELEGPGCIFRIWSANPEGVIRLYLDGDTEPTYQFDFDKLMAGEIEPFNRPFVWQRRVVLGPDKPGSRPLTDYRFWGHPVIAREDNPASVCYLPIPFAKSCRVTSTVARRDDFPQAPPRKMYYHIGYKLYPKDWEVETFSLPLKPRYKARLEEIARLWNACGTDPQPAPDARTTESEVLVKPGETVTLLDLPGPATVRQFFAKVESRDQYCLRNVVLRAFWDSEKEPGILTPIGDFFGRAVGNEEYRSLPLGMTDDMDYCYWRMPFRKRGVFTVENQGSEEVTLKYRFVHVQGPVPDDAGHFHAKWRRETNSSSFDYPILECTGSAGVFIGDILSVDVFLRRWWGEGGEKIYVDGEQEASTFGTGMEDYFGDAWGIRWFVNPLHGCPQNVARKQLMYRWHVADSMPFSESFRFVMENHSSLHNDFRNGYTSVAYWYQLPGGDDSFSRELPPPDERRPSPAIVMPYAIEAERIMVDGRKARIIDDPAKRDDYSWGRAVRSTGPTMDLVIQVEKEDIYSVALFEAPGKPLEEDACALLYKGKPVGKTVHLTEGRHELTIKLGPERSDVITLDYVTVTPYHRYITEWLVLGPFDNTDDKGFDTVYPPEEKPDFTAEYDVKGGKAKWRSVSAKQSGIVNFDTCFYPNDWGVAYACTEIVSPRRIETELLVGSDDGVKVWLNGELVHENHVHRPCMPDEDSAKIRLRKGSNTLLIKVDDGISDWGLAARIVDFDSILQYKLPVD